MYCIPISLFEIFVHKQDMSTLMMKVFAFENEIYHLFNINKLVNDYLHKNKIKYTEVNYLPSSSKREPSNIIESKNGLILSFEGVINGISNNPSKKELYNYIRAHGKYYSKEYLEEICDYELWNIICNL